VKNFYEPAILIGVRNTILIVDALSEFSHSLEGGLSVCAQRSSVLRRYWHKADTPTAPAFVAFGEQRTTVDFRPQWFVSF